MSIFYIISTPIGNLEDITIRAKNLLNNIDVIACEDSRITSKLLQKYNIKNNVEYIIYNDQATEVTRNKIINKINAGTKIALVSDAGTPLLSDPGIKLIKALNNHNIKTVPIPGVSSITTAASMSYLIGKSFLFLGFLPPKKISRNKLLQNYQNNYDYSLVIFESPQRILQLLTSLLEVFGDRKITICRELTKLYEEIDTDHINNLIIKYKTKSVIKGEFTIILEAKEKTQKSISISTEIQQTLNTLLNKSYSIKDASKITADLHHISKTKIYAFALAQSKS